MINEIFELSKEIYLVPWTVLMIISSIVTMLSLLSGVGTDLDFDTDVDVNTDLDINLDGGSFFQTFYLFLNVGKVPVTFIIFSIIAINWGLGLIANMIFNSGNYAIVGWIIFAVVFFISLPASKLLTNPLKSFFSKLIEDKESQTHSVGNVCTTVTNVTENSGQASIKEGPTIVNLMVKCEAGRTISKGKKAVVLSKDHSANRYIISEVEEEIFN